jgi:hypothetical protein
MYHNAVLLLRRRQHRQHQRASRRYSRRRQPRHGTSRAGPVSGRAGPGRFDSRAHVFGFGRASPGSGLESRALLAEWPLDADYGSGMKQVGLKCKSTSSTSFLYLSGSGLLKEFHRSACVTVQYAAY